MIYLAIYVAVVLISGLFDLVLPLEPYEYVGALGFMTFSWRLFLTNAIAFGLMFWWWYDNDRHT